MKGLRKNFYLIARPLLDLLVNPRVFIVTSSRSRKIFIENTFKLELINVLFNLFC